MSQPQILVHRDAETLAAAAAARLVDRIVAAQGARGHASVVLTGGGTGMGTLRAVRELDAKDAIDWSAVDLYWGDERFLPEGDPERNHTQAREALLDHVPLDPARVHVMAPSDGEFGDDVDKAAAAYAQVIESASVDVLMLGMGGEGHVASVFPDSPAVREKTATVVAVRDCPKPPPTRISLTLPLIRQSREVWLLTAGEAKSEAVAAALTGARERDIPAAGARGTQETIWFLDTASASLLL
ncbi:6-phosphogluconolactonase [Pseudonocardiaceae bacterium YIM PH 21723]|nr:6-phosphogluconolactonase [Pseudonocardiaceae bacterium YIM PH 21723]